MSTNRRHFLKKASLVSAGLSLTPTILTACQESTKQEINSRPVEAKYMGGFSAEKLETVRCAFIGVGARGSSHIEQISNIADTEVVAICDLYEDLAKRSYDKCKSIGKGTRHKDIAIYTNGDNDWKKMLKDIKPDIVIISTPWELHASMAIETMKHGSHAFVEVPLALTLDEIWEIINTSETTQKHCMMMENVNYGREELLYLNMCRQGVIGELLHAEAAYIHELRFQMNENNRGTGSWRTYHYSNRNGNLYPTHGLGPVSQYMNLARTDDNFKFINSFSSPSIGRKLYANKNFPDDHKWNQIEFMSGDINTSIIKTELGRTIMVQWDETSPRPYSRHNLIQGTSGTLAGFPTRVALEGGIEGASENHHSWVMGEQLAKIFEKYEHPLYKRMGLISKKMGGHGGMDFLMLYRIIECLKQGEPLDQNVYEGCFWSAVSPLSEISVAQNGTPQEFPDFTRGDWETTLPLDIIT
ncbi:Gfo/Idh/MocA family oxidoreductase [Yeosuana sp. MJ-SS3]|uniref:Gfo/Idh/MocA family oxidoreductase n=1 Tax=Gilvirhabdus luticola TaxID=3079858 RepID=A0ABU3U8Z8_9FLAO|nr:Gfo/Idh/MocA family oxidoreductase [Yeosuana sp. MJ-SS3]MDU8886851.1 Gfo/Idh/MocA family oxidoreductase [Yeosuana sp. MJ-SS3]